MTFPSFSSRIKTIKALRDKLDRVGVLITEAFSDDIQYNKFYADGFNYIEDMMVKDLVRDLSDAFGIDFSYAKDSVDYFIYEINFGTDQRQMVVITDGEETKYDVTLYNTWSEMKGTLKEDFDTFEFTRGGID